MSEGTQFLSNNIESTNSITIGVTIDNAAETPAVAMVPIMNGCGKTAGGLPSYATIENTEGRLTYAELQDAFQKFGIQITEIILNTSATSVYQQDVHHGVIKFNGDLPAPRKISLTDYDTGDNVLKIRNYKIVNTVGTYLKIPVAKNSYMSITIKYTGEFQGKVFPPNWFGGSN